MTTFKQLGLSNDILKALKELGFEQPSDIQQQAIPDLIQKNKDFIGLAQTGTGKTAAFGLPLLERIDPYAKHTQALVLAPTRELGQQIAVQLNKYSKYMEQVNVLAVYGGANISTQIKALKKTQHVVVATPGRLIDLIERKAVKLKQLEFIVLDEADEMLNMGFKEAIDKILTYTPEQKLTWLFSATMPKEIKGIVKKYMTEPIEVRINPKNEVNTNIDHQFVVVKQAEKVEILTRFLDFYPKMRAVVFCRTKRDTQNLADQLLKKKYLADALHGDLSQHQRDRVMGRFRQHHLQILIATDVAARGIDVNDLTHVVHYNLPDQDEYYTHRSGRTARAGKEGISIAFINGREQHKINRLEKQLKIKFKNAIVPAIENIAEIRIKNWCEQVLDTEVKQKNQMGSLFSISEELLGSLSKEELIHKVLSIELDKLNLKSKPKRNEKSNDRNSERDQKEKGKERKGKGGNQRFFINIGSRDKVNKRELVDFICSVAKIKRSNIGRVDIRRSHSYFEVEKSAERKIGNKFEDFVLDDGRELRVNKDG